MSTRDRKLRFIADHGIKHSASGNLEDAVAMMLALRGSDFLTDEQVEELADLVVRTDRARWHRHIRNRKILRANLGMPEHV